MTEKLPIVYSAHHASSNFGEYSNRVQLTPEQRVRFSDYGTAETVPSNGSETLIAEYSRGIIDLNRAPTGASLFPSKDFGQPEKNDIWKPGQELTEVEKTTIVDKIYHPYHERIINRLRTFHRTGLVIAWDNTAHYVIGNDESGKPQMMRPIILSNRGKEGNTSADPESGERTTCDPALLLEFGYQLGKTLRGKGLPDEIYYNLVYKGGYIVQRYNTYRSSDLGTDHEVQSFQIEYDTLITHDQKTLEPNPQAMSDLKTAVEIAMYETYKNLS